MQTWTRSRILDHGQEEGFLVSYFAKIRWLFKSVPHAVPMCHCRWNQIIWASKIPQYRYPPMPGPGQCGACKQAAYQEASGKSPDWLRLRQWQLRWQRLLPQAFLLGEVLHFSERNGRWSRKPWCKGFIGTIVQKGFHWAHDAMSEFLPVAADLAGSSSSGGGSLESSSQ